MKNSTKGRTRKWFLGIIVFILGISNIAIADQTVIFQWAQGGTTVPDGYMLFQRTQSQPYDYATPVWTGAGTTTTLTLPNGDYAFVIRAYIGTLQSGNSNEAVFTVDDNPSPVIIPGRPKQFTIIFQ